MMKNITRLQVELDTDKMNELESLMEEGGARTKKELINSALTLLRWAVKQRRAGRVIASLNEQTGGYKELEMEILSNIPVDKEAVVQPPRHQETFSGNG